MPRPTPAVRNAICAFLGARPARRCRPDDEAIGWRLPYVFALLPRQPRGGGPMSRPATAAYVRAGRAEPSAAARCRRCGGCARCRRRPGGRHRVDPATPSPDRRTAATCSSCSASAAGSTGCPRSCRPPTRRTPALGPASASRRPRCCRWTRPSGCTRRSRRSRRSGTPVSSPPCTRSASRTRPARTSGRWRRWSGRARLRRPHRLARPGRSAEGAGHRRSRPSGSASRPTSGRCSARHPSC